MVSKREKEDYNKIIEITFDLHVPQKNENILFEIQYEMDDLFIYSFIV